MIELQALHDDARQARQVAAAQPSARRRPASLGSKDRDVNRDAVVGAKTLDGVQKRSDVADYVHAVLFGVSIVED